MNTKTPHEILYTKPSEPVFSFNQGESIKDWYSEDDVIDAMIEFADQFKPKWIKIKESGNPETKTNCFFYSDDLRNPCDMVAGIYFPDDRGFMSSGHKWVNVTHWMPTPDKPSRSHKQKSNV